MIAAAIIVIILIGVAFVTVGVAWINDALDDYGPMVGSKRSETNDRTHYR